MGGYTGTPRVVPGRTGLYQDAPGYPQAHRATPGALDTTPLQGWHGASSMFGMPFYADIGLYAMFGIHRPFRAICFLNRDTLHNETINLFGLFFRRRQ